MCMTMCLLKSLPVCLSRYVSLCVYECASHLRQLAFVELAQRPRVEATTLVARWSHAVLITQLSFLVSATGPMKWTGRSLSLFLPVSFFVYVCVSICIFLYLSLSFYLCHSVSATEL